ncbi:MAG: hypothetical protein ABMA64_09980 [Myxococcota bacterium]
MSYDQAYREAWRAGGPAAALVFLRDLFHAPENQRIKGKPTDYLREDDTPSPAAGFDALVRWFAPIGPLQRRVDFVVERLLERRTDEDDQSHLFQPFNGLRLQIGDYDWGDAVLDSVSIDPETETWRRQYGLNHEILAHSDNLAGAPDPEEADYGFVYALSKESGSPYHLTFDGEHVPGKTLFVHLRAAQYGGWAAGLVDALFADERFADFPKALPFRCFVGQHDYAREGVVGRLEFHPPITLATLTGPLRDRIERSAAKPEPPTLEQRFEFLLQSVSTPDSPHRAALAALVIDHPALADRLRGLAEAALAEPGGDSPRDWASVGWTFDPGWTAGYLRRAWARPLPALPRRDLEAALAQVYPTLDDRFGGWRDTPEAERPALEPAFSAACAELTGADHPVWRLWGLEQVYRAREGMDPKIGRHRPPFQGELPEGYLSTLSECIDELPATFEWYGDKWSLVDDRLEWLGPRARPLAPRLVQLMDAWCTELRDGGQAIRMFAQRLREIGLEEPPRLVREHVERDRYHGIDGYAEWAAGAIDAKWVTFAARYAADPAAFGASAAWEEALYPSEAGHVRFHEQMRATDAGMIEAFEVAYERDPTPGLAPFARTLVKFYQRNHPGTEHSRHLVRLLGATPSLDDAQARSLRAAWVRLAWAAVDAADPSAEAELQRAVTHAPDAPSLAYVRAALAFDRDGPLAAGRVVIEAVRALVGDDLVYRKAFATYVGAPLDRAEPLDGYVLFRWAADRVRREHTRGGQWSGGESACLEDPLYEALARWVSPWTDEARARAAAEVREEAEFLEVWRHATDEELAQKLVQTNWTLSYQILRRLARAPERWVERALEAYRWFGGDEVRRRALLELWWPLEPMQDPLLREPAFQRDLPWFFARYPGVSAADLARTCFDRLIELGLPQVVLEVIERTPGETVVAVFVTVNRALEAAGDRATGVRVLEGVLARTNPMHPDYVMISSNLAALHVRAGELAAAERVFDQLFAMDWSRFDPAPGSDGMVAELFGFDLDEQLRSAFRQYFAMAKYNAACLYGLTGRAEACARALREAAAAHPAQVSVDKLTRDTDFDPVRADPAFTAVVDDLKVPAHHDDADSDDDGYEE